MSKPYPSVADSSARMRDSTVGTRPRIYDRIDRDRCSAPSRILRPVPSQKVQKLLKAAKSSVLLHFGRQKTKTRSREISLKERLHPVPSRLKPRHDPAEAATIVQRTVLRRLRHGTSPAPHV